MARTIGEIYDQMVEEKQSQAAIADLQPAQENVQTLLAALASSSKVAVWRLYMYIISVAIHYHELLFDAFKTMMEGIADAAIVGTVAWYQKQVYDFQLGVDLVYDEAKRRYVYESVNPSLQIVKRCAILERPDGIVLIKAAKLDNNMPTGLVQFEQDALVSYIKKIRFAGTRFVLVSGSGDQIKVSLNIYYDPIVLLSNVKISVEAAIMSYISSLPFNGVFQTSTLVDIVQECPGVSDVTVTAIESRYLTGGTWGTVGRTHVPNFGYYVFDTVAANTLAQTLNYIAV
jgi:hypothetical protein